MTGACVNDEELRLRNLSYEDFITVVQADVEKSVWAGISAELSHALKHDAQEKASTEAFLIGEGIIARARAKR